MSVSQIPEGDFNAGTRIVPKTFEKTSVKNGHFVPEN